MTPEELGAALRERCGAAILATRVDCSQLRAQIEPAQLRQVVEQLRDDRDLRFNFLLDVTAVDHQPREPRFDVVYQLAAVDVEPRGSDPAQLRHRLSLSVGIDEGDETLDSLTGCYASADWLEREVWDLYGLRFSGHPDLRRILLERDFQGHPLRKDFPKRGPARA